MTKILNKVGPEGVASGASDGDHPKLTNPSVAIVGGGASGIAVALHLLRDATTPLSITIFEPRSQLGVGIAYSTEFRSHVLNVPADNMSIFPDAPSHFLEWLRSNGLRPAEPDSFLPRATYGTYLRSVLDDACRKAKPGVTLEHVRARATRLSKKSRAYLVETDDGRAIDADAVVLALGNVAASNVLPSPDGPQPFSAWSSEALDGLAPDAAVLLIGSGLTAIDICLALRELHHRGRIYIVSRRGLLPPVHVVDVAARTWHVPEVAGISLLSLFSRIRSEAQLAARDGDAWQGVIDGLRPHMHEIWRRLGSTDKRRFLRRLRPYWDLYRHRIAPEAGKRIELMRREGQVEIVAGRITSAAPVGDGTTQVILTVRGGGEAKLRAQRVINCCGAEPDARRFPFAVLKQMVADGIARYDPLFLGVDATSGGALIASDGAVQDGLYAIGPLLKGVLWESIAMPEIRVQAAIIAADLLAHTSERAASDHQPEYATDVSD